MFLPVFFEFQRMWQFPVSRDGSRYLSTARQCAVCKDYCTTFNRTAAWYALVRTRIALDTRPESTARRVIGIGDIRGAHGVPECLQYQE